MLERFVRLCEIASPTGSERAVADDVLGELRGLGVEVARGRFGAGPRGPAPGTSSPGCPGAGEGWVMFAAHLDTVPHEGPIEVEFADGVFRSAGETILGADNKAAVTVLVELAARPRPARRRRSGLELVFTVAEEDGLRGAKELDLGSLRSAFGYVLDHASPIGEVIVAAPTYNRIEARVPRRRGARRDPARGRVQRDRGRRGGDRADAARPPRPRDDRERRRHRAAAPPRTSCPGAAGSRPRPAALDETRAAAVDQGMVDACTWGAGEHGCDLEVEVREMFRGYRLRPSAPAGRDRAARRCARRGHRARRAHTGGGSDANALLRAGFDASCSPTAPRRTTRPQESVAAGRIVEMLAVCEAIVDAAARGPG